MLVICQFFSAAAGLNAMFYQFDRVSYKQLAEEKNIESNQVTEETK
jgi:hypothetical protein